MSLIEGVGDEVTLMFVIMLILIVVALAWVSTNIRDIPFFSVIIVELTQRRHRLAAQENQNENNEEQTQQQGQEVALESVDPAQSSSRGEIDAVQAIATSSPTIIQTEITSGTNSSKDEKSENGKDRNAAEVTDIDDNKESQIHLKPEEAEVAEDKETGSVTPLESCDDDDNLSETELRRRRVAFFEQKKGDCDVDDTKGDNSDGIDTATTCDTDTLPCDKTIKSENLNQTPPTQDSSESSLSVENKECSHTLGKNDNEIPETVPSIDANSASIENDEVELRNGQIRIRLKYLNDTQRNVVASPDDTIGQFRRANFATELADNKLVRFIFNGRDLRNDSSTLQANNVVNNSVLHCLITTVNREPANNRVEADGGFDMGNVMLPLFGVLLLIVWYLRFEYRSLFTATSTISLIGVTSLYIAALLASWESHRRGNRHEHID